MLNLILVLFVHLFTTATLAQGFLPVQSITKQADLQGLTVQDLAIRSNNDILVTTSSPHACVYQVSPGRKYSPIKVACFPNVKAAHGIVELGTNKFYVTTSNSTISKSVPKSSHVFEVDMTSFQNSGGDIVQPAKVHKVADLPRAQYPGNIAAIKSSTTTLVADGVAGCVWRVDIHTGDVTQIKDATDRMAALGGTGMGIDGIKVVTSCGSRYLYYTNTSKKTLSRALIKTFGAINGPPQAQLSDLAYGDLDVDGNGVVYVTSAGGGLYNLAGGPTPDDDGAPSSLVIQGALVNPTSVRFGRGDNAQLLYVTTNAKSGGGISSVDTSSIITTNSC